MRPTTIHSCKFPGRMKIDMCTRDGKPMQRASPGMSCIRRGPKVKVHGLGVQ